MFSVGIPHRFHMNGEEAIEKKSPWELYRRTRTTDPFQLNCLFYVVFVDVDLHALVLVPFQFIR